MGMSIGSGGMKSEPNVVPLCDILLVLLIIFMVVTPMIVNDFKGTLPQAANTIDQPTSSQVTLRLERDGTIVLNREMIADRSVLRDRIAAVFEGRTDKVLYFKADSSLEYNAIQDVLDVARAAGVEKIGVVTERLAGEEVRALLTN